MTQTATAPSELGPSQLKPTQLQALLAKTIPARVPILIKGAPGISKTECVRQASRSANADLFVMHPVVKNPTDFQGMPWISNGEASFIPFGDLRKLIQANSLTVCFIDDLGQASPAVQAAAMQLLLARELDGQRISDQVVFIAATNRRTDRAGVLGLLEPVKGRFHSIVELVPNLNDWVSWAVGAQIAPEIIAFLRFRPELFFDFAPTADLTKSPSPRTWHQLSDLLALGLPSDVELPSVQGAIGEGAATEFVAFRRVWASMSSPDLVLTNPDAAAIPSEPSALYAIATALAYRVTRQSMTNFCRYLTRMCSAQFEEFAAVSMKLATARDTGLQGTSAYVNAMAGPLGQLMVGA
jgi:hypothetical protein